ncbi:hypothetical protein [Pedobacter zeae]|uniref:Uncharacterized protein n=1 Tax=Pedobacter zeae TaxID=1737356 RepID=A0A7W6K8A7_9SPHI|nr:hypothetical protein [Pedobacter zeae]MBB4106111.1 hypothetical protein [Pedobacter zeae]
MDKINYNIFCRSMPRWHGSFSQLLVVPNGAQECCAFWSAKVPKALRQSAMSLFHNPMHIKKTVALRFVFNIFLKLKLSL